MLNRFFLLVFLGVMSTPLFAKDVCFLAQENGVVIKQDGDCALRQAPCSTFKFAISLMGFNEGILIDSLHPQWDFKEGYPDFWEVWKQPQTPESWIKNSCVWYSQVITQKLGIKKFADYVHAFNYGNQDVSGDKGKDNGLTRPWLSSSLRISPLEQIEFLQRLYKKQLPVSVAAIERTKRLFFVEELPDGWELFGKTGAGYFFDAKGIRHDELTIGWFVGWIEKNKSTVFFAQFVMEKNNKDFSTGKHARELVKNKLVALIGEKKGSV